MENRNITKKTKNSIEPHQNFTGSYEKSLEVLDKLQHTQNMER